VGILDLLILFDKKKDHYVLTGFTLGLQYFSYKESTLLMSTYHPITIHALNFTEIKNTMVLSLDLVNFMVILSKLYLYN